MASVRQLEEGVIKVGQDVPGSPFECSTQPSKFGQVA